MNFLITNRYFEIKNRTKRPFDWRFLILLINEMGMVSVQYP